MTKLLQRDQHILFSITLSKLQRLNLGENLVLQAGTAMLEPSLLNLGVHNVINTFKGNVASMSQNPNVSQSQMSPKNQRNPSLKEF